MEFFGGANTKNGFVSIFDRVFSSVKRLYILKGSSGCGKSTFMRRVAGRAQKAGYETHLIYCSGDPDSLDAVIIPKLSLAVADGTAPHAMDTVYPCVRENIINLGEFWQEEKLLPRRDEIINITDKKSLHYKKAYGALRSYGEAMEVKRTLLMKCVDKGALEKYAFKLAEDIMKDRGNKTEIFASAFTFGGIKTLNVFDKVKTHLRFGGKSAEALMQAIWRIANEKGVENIAVLSPLDATMAEGIYFPATDALVSCSFGQLCQNAEKTKNISTARFIDSNCLQSVRARITALEKLGKELLVNAADELKNARENHKRLEEIYIPAMDFHRLDEFTFEFLEKIFTA